MEREAYGCSAVYIVRRCGRASRTIENNSESSNLLSVVLKFLRTRIINGKDKRAVIEANIIFLLGV